MAPHPDDIKPDPRRHAVLLLFCANTFIQNFSFMDYAGVYDLAEARAVYRGPNRLCHSQTPRQLLVHTVPHLPQSTK